jgi:hypothetical protein
LDTGYVEHPFYLAAIGGLCGVLGFRLGWRMNLRAALPLLQGLAGFLAFAVAWRAAGAIASSIAVAGWALGNTLYALPVFAREHESIDARVIGARIYRELRFMSLGELRPDASLRRSARTRELGLLIVFCTAALTTLNLLSLVIGAAMLNAMNAYVAVLLRAARSCWTVRLLAWDGWNVVRATSMTMIGCALAAPLAARLGYPVPWNEVRWLLGMGGIGLVLSPVLRSLLAETTGRLLGRAVELGPRPDRR